MLNLYDIIILYYNEKNYYIFVCLYDWRHSQRIFNHVGMVSCLPVLSQIECVGQGQNKMSQCMRFSTIWYVRPAKPQISLRIRAV